MKNKTILLLQIAMLSAVVFLGACSKNVKKDDAAAKAQAEVESNTDTNANVDETDGILPLDSEARNVDTYTQSDKLLPIPFNYDKYMLSEEAQKILRNNAGYLNSNRHLQVIVEGYCDDRGTTEYNLSLGQKRANAVRDYYVRLGVKPASINTISYGEEKQLCSESTEECWQLNRRAETKAK